MFNYIFGFVKYWGKVFYLAFGKALWAGLLVFEILAYCGHLVMRYHPQWSVPMSNMLWEIPMGIILAVLVIRLLMIPFEMYQGKKAEQASPKLLRFEKCFINSLGFTSFELLIHNSGLTPCSLISGKLTWPDGSDARLSPDSTTPLPKAIFAGLTERIIMQSNQPHRADNRNNICGTITLEFDVANPITEKIQFST